MVDEGVTQRRAPVTHIFVPEFGAHLVPGQLANWVNVLCITRRIESRTSIDPINRHRMIASCVLNNQLHSHCPSRVDNQTSVSLALTSSSSPPHSPPGTGWTSCWLTMADGRLSNLRRCSRHCLAHELGVSAVIDLVRSGSLWTRQ